TPATLIAHTATPGTYGTFAIDSAGAWTFPASSPHNQTATLSPYTTLFRSASADGTLTSVTIHIAGTNDAAVLSADVANLTETNQIGSAYACTPVTITDLKRPSTFVAQAATAGTYGTFAIDSAGAWTYTASS